MGAPSTVEPMLVTQTLLLVMLLSGEFMILIGAADETSCHT